MRDGLFPIPCLTSDKDRENEDPSHFELPLLQYLPENPLCMLSSSTCWSRFLEQAPPIYKYLIIFNASVPAYKQKLTHIMANLLGMHSSTASLQDKTEEKHA